MFFYFFLTVRYKSNCKVPGTSGTGTVPDPFLLTTHKNDKTDRGLPVVAMNDKSRMVKLPKIELISINSALL